MTAIAWCRDRGRIPALVVFFIEHTDAEYISHGELIDGRADAPGEWSPRLRDVLTAEFSHCDFEGTDAAGKRLVIMERDGATIAIALVELAGNDAFLHDLVVATTERGRGTGRVVLDWVEAAARDAGCKRLFLESGIANGDAHRFFQRAGYAAVSQVMTKTL